MLEQARFPGANSIIPDPHAYARNRHGVQRNIFILPAGAFNHAGADDILWRP